MFNIGQESLWVDEAISLSQTSRGFGEALYLLKTDVHPPLYTTLLWIWTTIFGQTEIAARSLSALIGTLIIPATYALGKKITSSTTGLIAATLVTVNPFLIQYSQEARMYSLFILLGVLSTYYVLDYYEKGDMKLYAIVTILLAYTHYLSWILIAIHGVIASIKQPKDIRNHAGLGAILIASYIPWITHLYEQAQNLGGVSWIPPTTYNDVITTILTLVGGTTVFPIIFFFIILTTMYAIKNREGKTITLLSIAVTPLFLLISISTLGDNVFVTRYIAYLSPLLILSASTGINRLNTAIKPIMVIGIILIMLPGLQTQYEERANPSWDLVAEEIENRPVAVLPDYDMISVLYYTNKSCFTERIHFRNNKTLSNCSNITGYTSKEAITEKTIIISPSQEKYHEPNTMTTSKYKNITTKNSPIIKIYYEE